MPAIRLRGLPGGMACVIDQVPAFPGAQFAATIPEAIGDASAPLWPDRIAARWEPHTGAGLTAVGSRQDALAYTVTCTATEETVDIRIRLTNRGRAPWRQSMAFNCFSAGAAPGVRDHECLRHWVGAEGRPVALRSLPRRFGPRPTVQLYPLEGGPAWQDMPFLRGFGCSPDGVALEPWIAIAGRDGGGLVAAASRPGLFLFHNSEYSCIHAAPAFGPLEPGQTGHALTRLYFVRQPLRRWVARMKREMAAERVGP